MTCSSRALREIAEAWATGDKEKSAQMLNALLRSFWRGELPMFRFEIPSPPCRPEGTDGFGRNVGQYRVTSDGNSKISAATNKFGDPLAVPTADHRLTPISRQSVAEVLGGMPEYFSVPWDGSDDALNSFGEVPYEAWPKAMRVEHLSHWRVSRDEFAAWYASSAFYGGREVHDFWPTGGAGRPAGTGYARADAPLLDEMARLLRTGEATTINDAARKLAPQASGPATLESKQSRLAKSYSREFKANRDD